MATDFYTSLLSGSSAWINFSSRAKWRLSGTDRVRYLNGQVTQDVRAAKSTAALYACVTNVKGRIEGDVFIHASPDGESLIIDADASLRDPLGMRLERYIIADDAVLEDITDEWQLWHLVNPPVDATNLALAPEGHSLTNAFRFHLPGRDLWLPASTPPPSTTGLSEAEAETLRILQRVPAFPHELNAETFPQEAGLETSAMSFTKGCYIGQEILSRIKTTGKMPRQLLAFNSPDTIVTGDALLDDTDKEVGTVTSVTRNPASGGYAGLALVKQAASARASFQTSGEAVLTIAR